ncbi:MAG: hypothetical protein P8Y48_15145 [Novosphingobium sp.]
MAFIDFHDAAPGALPVSNADLPADIRTVEQPVVRVNVQASAEIAGFGNSLTVLEHRIIELAREDSLETLQPPRKRGWFARLIFGPEPASSMLANERLEALRRLAVHAWHNGYQLPASALNEARAAGFNDDEIGAVIDTIGRARPPFQRPSLVSGCCPWRSGLAVRNTKRGPQMHCSAGFCE